MEWEAGLYTYLISLRAYKIVFVQKKKVHGGRRRNVLRVFSRVEGLKAI